MKLIILNLDLVHNRGNSTTTGKKLLLTIFLILSTASPLLAIQGGNHTLRGKVYLPDNQPPPQSVAVKLFDKTGVPLAEVFTDASGSYSFSNVPNGNYEVIVEGDGRLYERTVLEVEVFFSSGSKSQVATRNINLQPKLSTTNLNPGGTKLDASIPKDARKEYDKAVKSAQNGKSQEAIEHFQQAIKLYQNYYDAHLGLGQEYSKTRDFSSAQTALKQAIEIKPKDAQAHLQLGVVLVKSNQHNEAISPLREALSLGAGKVETYLFLGVALMETNSNDEAEKMLLKAFDLGGNTQPGLRLYLANFYNRCGDRVKTLQQLEAYVREAPTAANVAEIEKLIKHLREQK